MRFLVDENLGPAVARWLRGEGHEVFSVYDELRGLDDDRLIEKAFAENWILITNDKYRNFLKMRDEAILEGWKKSIMLT